MVNKYVEFHRLLLVLLLLVLRLDHNAFPYSRSILSFRYTKHNFDIPRIFYTLREDETQKKSCKVSYL